MQKKRGLVQTRAWREGTGLIVFVGTALLATILFSYDSQEPTRNLMGRFGNELAYFFYYWLGYVAYLCVPLMVLVGYRLCRAQDKDTEHLYGRIIRGLSMVWFVPSSAALFSISFNTDLPASAGGELGRMLGVQMLDVFGGFGAIVLLALFCLIALGLITGLSWLQVLEIIGSGCLWVIAQLRRVLAPKAATQVKHSQIPALLVKQGRRLFRPKEPNPPPASPKRIEPRLTFMPGRSLTEEHKEQPGAVKKTEDQTKITTAEAPPVIQPKKERQDEQIETPNQSEQIETPSQSGQIETPGRSEPTKTPSLDCLMMREADQQEPNAEDYQALQQRLVERLNDFGIQVSPVGYSPGPVVTLFEIQPAAGIKASRISNLATDLARSLAVDSIRVLEFIRGKSSVGVEIPNAKRRVVSLREVLDSPSFANFAAPLPLALGQSTEGQPVITSLAEMPHLLVAGTTGSGKSVGINAMLLSLLFKYGPDELRLILVDPKMLELASYNDIPHLLVPVITDMREASRSIGWCVKEMDERYALMAKHGVRNITSYNQAAKTASDLKPLPYLVVVIDEYADMIMTNKKVEKEIVRLAQKARAAGIHLILATQRPSVDVITGLIKANIPARISFKVSARVDSRTVLDQNGAEQLLGRGDMLYIASGGSQAVRVHGEFVEDSEVRAVVAHWKKQQQPEYRQEVLAAPASTTEDGEEEDELYAEALAFTRANNRVSISSIQRRFKIGYNRAARIIELMEKKGMVSEMDNNGRRTLLT